MSESTNPLNPCPELAALLADGERLEPLAEQVGTPFYLYSRARLEDNLERAQNAFGARGIELHYAMKANANLSLLRLIAARGLGVDLVSGGELLRAQQAGFAARQMIFSGVGKTAAELTTALRSGVGQINVESAEELALLAQLCEQLQLPVTVALRVNPDVEVDTHAHISTGRLGDKFGLPVSQAEQLFADYRHHPLMSVSGLAMHIGSQIDQVAPYQRAIERLLALVERLAASQIEVSCLDLGGGFAVDYGDGRQLSFADIAAVIATATANFSGRVCVEPGRSLVADSGVLVARVVRIKQSEPRPFVIIDAAMNDLLRPALYQARHPLLGAKGEDYRCDLVGPVCESSDTFARDYPVGEQLAEGDLVALGMAGAYGAVMSCGYNGRRIAPEVLLDGEQLLLVRKPIEVADMLNYESPVSLEVG